MRWPWRKRTAPIDPELEKRIRDLERRAAEHLDAVRQVADESRDLAERTLKTREWAKAMHERNHFVEAYLPPQPRKFRIPWKRS